MLTWRKGTKQIENIMPSVVADYAFALDRRANLDVFVFLVNHFVRHNLQQLAGLAEQLQVLVVRDDRLAEVDGAVHHRLFLLAFENTGNDALRGDAIAAIVDDDRAQRVQPFDIDRTARKFNKKVRFTV